MKRFVIAAAAGAAVLSLLGACGSDSNSSDAVAVVATDSSCKPAKTSFEAGPITFEVTNDGDKTTEMYVYGDNDRPISEVENIGPGTSRDLTVDLKAGHYELACKPGQTGDGIRTAIEVTGAGGEAGSDHAKADREVKLGAVDYSFTGLDGFAGKA
ncbi:MAG: cupredoxin domain-containing protein, partial [Actinobacteria bacterium]|nr:cupredoxin domain-containing protein [Actinomycetota bacterium]